MGKKLVYDYNIVDFEDGTYSAKPSYLFLAINSSTPSNFEYISRQLNSIIITKILISRL